ncbi:outer membrane family protein [Helicobacter sp. MIT 14-3879]|uniref:outer membrane family protein n=1 Tax=Helicobacter sp. MIT 14-3879 TaxID=2040649 RepID=UPI000E1F2721|nr:outer membrane family protein [Helicobacter sp. MIT 14-3879]RDU62898.1 hypothetical protein CQA44_06275 [Helicobacter sp. MIT 14-3879]
MRYLVIFVILLVLNADEEANNIHIESSTPLEEKLKDSELMRFIDEGILSEDKSKEFRQSKVDDEEYDNKPLVSIYKKIMLANSNVGNINSVDSTQDSVKKLDLTSNSTSYNTSSSEDNDVPSLLENVYGHIGFFGKTNVLNHSVFNSYGVFSGSVGLVYDFKKIVFVDIGLYGMLPISGNNHSNILRDSNLSHSAFTTYRANVKYVATDSYYNEFFDITIGRFQERRDWIRNYAQGVQLNANYGWVKVWLDWLDEQAYVNREYVTDFNVFKKVYNDEWLIAGGLGLSVFGVDVLPYYYYMNNNFWAAGGKLGIDIEFNNKTWRNIAILHYVYLNNKRNFRENESKKSQILWLEEMLRYKIDDKSVSFGLGYVQIFGSYFELANIGNISRFDTYNTQGYGIMSPGGIDNGGNSTNMFFSDTRSIYGFLGFRIGNFSMMFLGRNSNNNSKPLIENRINQHQYSLGARYRIIEGLYLGGVGVFMLENRLNKSYAKGYIEFRI